ncbi:MAG TPA: diguanylate cyclase [Steroidobacteraceae bacterium]|jgi:diguanylate cyclase (GGDEF)-like protein|nr:diguanylate cyclase [Steroidobacteraceae bacterium]
MSAAHGIPNEDLPDSPHARQLRAGFPWLTFGADLEADFRHKNFDENLHHTRVNLCLAILFTIAFSAMDSTVLGPELNRIPSMIRMLVIVPVMLIGFAASFSARRQRICTPIMIVALTIVGLSGAAVQIVASLGGITTLFPSLMITILFIYLLGGLIFYHAVAANVFVMFMYLAVGTALMLPGREFSHDALAVLGTNLFGASVAYMHEKTSRKRFLEACLLREMVARDGLTGIQNRRMFDQHIARAWQQAVREEKRIAVLLADIDCFKDYNDHYGHQAGDECLRAVAVSLSQCARRPLDFVARYGGEEFAIVLYQASHEYVAEVLTRIQRSIAELNIPHDASRVASRLTVSIGAAFVLPAANRTLEGLIQLADEALYSAKEEGRNRVIVMEAEYHTMTTGRFEKRRSQVDA